MTMTPTTTIWQKIWDNPLAKEFILMLAAVIATQLALGLTSLLGLVDTVKDWGDLLTSVKAWGGAFLFATTITAIKQTIAWVIAKLAGSQL